MAIRADGKVLDDDLDNVSKLQKSRRYIDIIQKVEDALMRMSRELESIVPHPIDYARVVNKIGNQMDVDLDGLLPSATTTIGKPLREDVLVQACNRALALDSAKKKLVHFVENRMGYIAPNLSAVVGSEVAAKLMGSAGGLSSAKLPCFDVELLGAERKELPAYPSHSYDIRPLGAGYINQSKIFMTTPPNFRIQTYQLLEKKSILAAGMDSTRGDPTGEYGTSLREEILQTIEKWQKPRPVPVPTESEPCKRRRGGRVPQRKRNQHMIL
ncbi:hypothetical protein RND71_000711 [Anisodus tanguticus]|uniref:Nop domain-containing protein n=1 Tax=Anisodus tanguticus TaxID=243964 RepID=A0AAE1VXQ3_9SOLA|nr:hypothetical protein RND71_000711 [Anisodus tanguticus]